ncbi:hypothetical protein TURTL08_02120 [Turicimonas sp. TL08]
MRLPSSLKKIEAKAELKPYATAIPKVTSENRSRFGLKIMKIPVSPIITGTKEATRLFVEKGTVIKLKIKTIQTEDV